MMISDKNRDNGHKIKHGRFSLNTRKHFLTVMATEHWNRLLSRFLECFILEGIQKPYIAGHLAPEKLTCCFLAGEITQGISPLTRAYLLLAN